jgi:hypothetical protein
MARPPRDGDFYINNANQDFWLRENGAWVRKGNIRDEGTSGLVGVQPILNLGFAQASAVQRIRLLAPGAQAMGFATAVAVDRIRQLSASMTLGYGMLSPLDRLRAVAAAIDVGMGLAAVADAIPSAVINLAAAMGFGSIVSPVVVGRERDLVAPMNFGSDVSAVLVLRVRQLTASMALGVDETAAIQQIKAVAASMAMGYDETVALQRIRALTSSIAVGYSEAAAVTRSRQLTDSVAMGFLQTSAIQQIKAVTASLAMGYSEAAAVTRIRQLTDSVAMGFAQASTVSLTAPSGNVVIGLSVSPFTLWYDSNLSLLTTSWTVPAASIQAIEFSPDKSLLVIATSSALFRYDMTGATPVYKGAMTSPPAWAHISALAFSADSTRLAVVDSQLSPFTWVFNTSTWTTVTAPTGPTGTGVAFNGAGASKIAAPISSPVTLKLFDTPGMTASATQPGTQPTLSNAYSNIDFSPDGNYLAANGVASPSPMRVWQMSALSAPLANPASMPHASDSVIGKALRWNAQSTKFAVCDNFGTYGYRVSGTTVTQDQTISTIQAVAPAYRSDGAKLYLLNASAPRFQVFSISGNTYTADTNPTSQPASGSSPNCIATSL